MEDEAVHDGLLVWRFGGENRSGLVVYSRMGLEKASDISGVDILNLPFEVVVISVRTTGENEWMANGVERAH